MWQRHVISNCCQIILEKVTKFGSVCINIKKVNDVQILPRAESAPSPPLPGLRLNRVIAVVTVYGKSIHCSLIPALSEHPLFHEVRFEQMVVTLK